jgi:hypothetical protein
VQRLDRRHRQLGVPLAGHAQVGHDPAAQPRIVHALAHRVDHTADLAAGDGGQIGQRERPARSARADRRIEQVDTHGPHRDPHLPRLRLGVVDLLVDEVVGRAEGVEADGVHAVDGTDRQRRQHQPAG